MERRRCGWFSLISGGLLVLAGCGQQANSGGGGAAASAAGAGASNKAGQNAAAADDPAVAVRHFLEAVRTGNDAEALRWLTPLAREKTQEMHMSVAPPGTETSQFEVGEVELVDGGAHVASTWSDLDSDGNRHADPIVWLLAKEPEGWRIAGMATTLFEEKLPIVLNFEEPEEMIQKQQFAEAEAVRRAAPATGQPASVPVQSASPPASANPSGPQQDRMTKNSASSSTEQATAGRNVLRQNAPR